MKRIVLMGLALAATLAATPASADKKSDTLRWATRQTISSADPYYNEFREAILIIGQMVWDTLIYRDPVTQEYKPLLASSYTWKDNVTIEFDLRRDVKFHDGKGFDADDVVYTLNYVANPDNKINIQSNVNWIKSAEKLDQYKVRLNLKAPFPSSLEYLAGPVAILPNGFFNEAGPSRLNVKLNGTGPYKFTKWEPGKQGEFEINKAYMEGSPKGKPSIGKIQFRIIPDQSVQLAELLSGGVDWIWQVANDQAEKLAKMPNVKVSPSETMRVSFLMFDVKGRAGDHPFKDVRVRKAVSYGIDREGIVKNLIGAGSRVVHSACFPAQFGCTDQVERYPFDPAKAKALLAEAGYPNGFEIDMYGYRERRWIEAIIGNLANIGIKAKLTYLQYSALREKVHAGEVKFTDMSWGSYSINDVSAFVNAWFTFLPDDLARDQEVKDWLDKASASVDQAERKSLYDKALKKVAAEAYVLPLYTNPVIYAYTNEVDFTSWADENPRFFLTRWK